jgi:hypothetical protein
MIKTESKKKAKRAAPYVRRTLEDKRVHDHVRAAAGSLRAALRIVREPEPEPQPKRRGRKLLLVLAAVGAAAIVVKKRASSGGDGSREYSAERPAEPVEPAHATQAA